MGEGSFSTAQLGMDSSWIIKMFGGCFIALPIVVVLAYFAITQENATYGKVGFFVCLSAVAWAKVFGRIYLMNLAQDQCPKCSVRVRYYFGDSGKELQCDKCGSIWATAKPQSAADPPKKTLPKKIDVSGLD